MGTFAELSNTEFDFAKLLTSADETVEDKDKDHRRLLEGSSGSLKTPFNAVMLLITPSTIRPIICRILAIRQ